MSAMAFIVSPVSPSVGLILGASDDKRHLFLRKGETNNQSVRDHGPAGAFDRRARGTEPQRFRLPARALPGPTLIPRSAPILANHMPMTWRPCGVEVDIRKCQNQKWLHIRRSQSAGFPRKLLLPIKHAASAS